MLKSVLAAGVILSACGGGTQGPAPVSPMASPSQTVTAFMRAAADSNLSRMAELWGSSKGSGSAAATHNPPDYEKRMVLLQAYLRADSSNIVSNMPVTGDDNRRRIIVAIFRQGCMKQVPATVMQVRKNNWIIVDIDVTGAGNPARPCEPTL